MSKVVRIHKRCPSCQEGEMKPTGSTLLTYPPKYEHICAKCTYKADYKIQYPYTEFEDVEDRWE